jgi:hypothetical protein
MKRIVLIFTFIVYFVCLFLSIFAFFSLDLNYKTVIVFILSIITLYAVYNVFVNKKVELFCWYLTILNLLQSFTFLFFGFSYKFLLGSNVFLYYYIKDKESLLRFSFKIFETNLYVNYEESNDFLIGINVVPFILFLCFNYYLRESRKVKVNIN